MFEYLAHEGLSAYRCEENPIEKIFAQKWEEKQINNRTLFYLIDKNESPVTQHDATVAATVIQWLGSPVGSDFLRDVQSEIESLI